MTLLPLIPAEDKAAGCGLRTAEGIGLTGRGFWTGPTQTGTGPGIPMSACGASLLDEQMRKW